MVGGNFKIPSNYIKVDSCATTNLDQLNNVNSVPIISKQMNEVTNKDCVSFQYHIGLIVL